MGHPDRRAFSHTRHYFRGGDADETTEDQSDSNGGAVKAQLLQAEELRDYPRMLIALEPHEWQAFFREEARKIGPEVLD